MRNRFVKKKQFFSVDWEKKVFLSSLLIVQIFQLIVHVFG